MKLNKKTEEWLDSFAKFHKLKTKEKAIEKLIEVHKAWNKKVEEAVTTDSEA